MKPELLQLLQCPACQGELDLHAFSAGEKSTAEIEAGLLICRRCAAAYPIADGVPRMLPNALRRRPNFVREHAHELKALSFKEAESGSIRTFERLHALTARAFGYEWNTYKTTSEQEDLLTFAWLTGADPKIYEKFHGLTDVFTCYPTDAEVAQIDTTEITGRRVLEVGCGMGKYLKIASSRASEVIGLDLSDSLARARNETRALGNVQLVQGNILQSPLRPGSIDFVYSVGVLHHTPDCHKAFQSSARLVRPGGGLSVWLYPTDPTPGEYAKRVHWIQDDVMRPITCRMPLWSLRLLCKGLGRLTFVRDRYAEKYRATGSRLAYRIAMTAGAVAVGRHQDPEIAAFLNFDWYSPQYRSYHTEDELAGWYKEAGFDDTRILPQRVSAIGHRSEK